MGEPPFFNFQIQNRQKCCDRQSWPVMERPGKCCFTVLQTFIQMDNESSVLADNAMDKESEVPYSIRDQ